MGSIVESILWDSRELGSSEVSDGEEGEDFGLYIGESDWFRCMCC